MAYRLRAPWPAASTRSFYREARRLGFSLFEWLHAWLYLRIPYTYIAVGTGEHRFSRPIGRLWDRLYGQREAGSEHDPLSSGAGRPAAASPIQDAIAQGYHGKVTRLDDARALVTFDRPIRITASEQVIPYRHARDIVLENPDHIAVLDCPCRAARDNPCLPLDVCLIVGEPFASFVVEHHADRARWITQTEAVEILEQEHERGHVHHAFLKDAMLERFYAICNCCSCCCGAMQAYRNGTPMLASSGYVSCIDEELCIACGACEEICPFDAVAMADLGTAAIDEAACMGCGVCVDACPVDAHRLVRDPSKGDPLDIRALAAGCPVIRDAGGMRV